MHTTRKSYVFAHLSAVRFAYVDISLGQRQFVRECGWIYLQRANKVKMTAMVYWNYEGTNFPYTVTKQTLEALPEYQIRDDDIVVVSYPRAGSNWLLEIIGKLLKAAGKTTESADSIITEPIEVILACCKLPGYVTLADKPSPRLVKTSLPIQFAPRGISNPRNQVKVIVVMRNPKDTAVSFYHFNKKLCQLQGVEEPVSWGEFAQAFVSGKVSFGDHCDHMLGWWQMRDDPHFLFLKYEDMTKDLPKAVKTIAAFLEVSLDEATLTAVAEDSAFDRIKEDLAKSQFPSRRINARKGIVGDWKTLFTAEENNAFDAWYGRKLGGTGIVFDFE
ncbi:sulfotransferase 1B1-like isoform X2 [Branchiostoma lanceolatum]|uniref:sulfotransferase 1B1-like isoform X2 n=1 Tax=Branchiostoma lanceolatum TaxID=7740 RepID=UPI0034536F27